MNSKNVVKNITNTKADISVTLPGKNKNNRQFSEKPENEILELAHQKDSITDPLKRSNLNEMTHLQATNLQQTTQIEKINPSMNLSNHTKPQNLTQNFNSPDSHSPRHKTQPQITTTTTETNTHKTDSIQPHHTSSNVKNLESVKISVKKSPSKPKSLNLRSPLSRGGLVGGSLRSSFRMKRPSFPILQSVRAVDDIKIGGNLESYTQSDKKNFAPAAPISPKNQIQKDILAINELTANSKKFAGFSGYFDEEQLNSKQKIAHQKSASETVPNSQDTSEKNLENVEKKEAFSSPLIEHSLPPNPKPAIKYQGLLNYKCKLQSEQRKNRNSKQKIKNLVGNGKHNNHWRESFLVLKGDRLLYFYWSGLQEKYFRGEHACT